jgi:signal transduction histidine kinase
VIYTSYKRALITNTILVAALPVLVFGLISISVQKKDMEKIIIRESRSIAKSIAAETKTYLNQAELNLSSLNEIDRSDKRATRTIIDSLLVKKPDSAGDFESIQLLDRKGRVIAEGVAPFIRAAGKSKLGKDMSGLDVCRNAAILASPCWSSTFISPLSHQVVLTLAIPVPEGMILGTLGLAPLNAITGRVQEDNGYAYIVNREGRLIVHPDQTLVAQQYDASGVSIVREGLAGKNSTSRYMFQGVERLGSVVVIPETGWLVAVAERTDIAFAPLARLEKLLGAGMIAVIILAAFSAIWSLGRLFRPLTQLTANVQKVAAGEYALETPPVGFTEIDQLSAAVHVMAEAVVEREQELNHRNEELMLTKDDLHEQINEYLKVQDELRSLTAQLELRINDRTAQLESANQELKAFCCSVSHDLRAPLGHICACSRMLIEEETGLDDFGRECLRRIERDSARLLNMTEALMDMHQLTQCDMKYEEIDLSDMVQEIAAELQKSEPERHASFAIAPGVRTQGDSRLLRIVVQNLLCNAWKYTGHEEAPQIVFGTSETTFGRAQYIRDNGVGFNMNQANRLFSPFSRLHRADEFPGTGIGLATVQRIVSRHGGKVWAEAEQGQGATFYFTVAEQAA